MEENQRKILLKWRARYKRAQLAHNYTAISYGRFHYSIGISLILFTTGASVITFAEFVESYEWVSIAIPVLATILAAFQTFMKFSEQADIHRSVGRRYGELKKEIEYILNFTPELLDLPEIINTIRKKDNEIAQESPNSLSYNWKRAEKRTQEDNDKYSIRGHT